MLIRKQDLLEKAFCEGYSYAQKEFSNAEQKALRDELYIKVGKKARNKALFNYISSLGLNDKNLSNFMYDAGIVGLPILDNLKQVVNKDGLGGITNAIYKRVGRQELNK